MSNPPAATAPSAQGGGPAKRQLRNYLLNPRFQLKYAGLLVAVALLLMSALGVVVWRQASTAADQAERAMRESQTSNRLVRMNRLMTPEGDNPELVASIYAELRDLDRQGERNLAEVRSNRQRMAITLIGASVLLVVLLGFAGIVITHRVVGPVFKLKRLLRQVGSGKLEIRERLRKGDELEDLFETFLQMTGSLQQAQKAEVAQVGEILEQARASGASQGVVDGLQRLHQQMERAITGD